MFLLQESFFHQKKLKVLLNHRSLIKIKDWRKKLDNSYIMDNLVIDTNNWSSISHYMYAQRFYNIKEIYNNFIKDSGHEASLSIENARNYYNKLLATKNELVKSYQETFDKNKSKILEKALSFKFAKTNKELYDLLVLTNQAKIMIFNSPSEPRKRQ